MRKQNLKRRPPRADFMELDPRSDRHPVAMPRRTDRVLANQISRSHRSDRSIPLHEWLGDDCGRKCGNEDRVVPSLRFRILEEVVANPEHQALPVIGWSSLCPSLRDLRFQKTRAAGIKLTSHFARKGRAGFESGSEPNRQLLPSR